MTSKRTTLALLCAIAAPAMAGCMEYTFFPDKGGGDPAPTCYEPDCPDWHATVVYDLDMDAIRGCYWFVDPNDPTNAYWLSGTPSQIVDYCEPTSSTCDIEFDAWMSPQNALCEQHQSGDPFTGSCSYDTSTLSSPDYAAFAKAISTCSSSIAPQIVWQTLDTSSVTWSISCACDDASRLAAPQPPPGLKLTIDPRKSFVRFTTATETTTVSLGGGGSLSTQGTRVLTASATAAAARIAGDDWSGWTLSFKQAIQLAAGGDTFRIPAAARPEIDGRGLRNGKATGLRAFLDHDAVGHLHTATHAWDLDFSDQKAPGALSLHLEGALSDP